MKKLAEWKNTLLILASILFIGFFLRTVNITELPVFGDEAIYVRWSQVMRASPENRFIPLSDGKQPLFMWSVIPFLKIINDPVAAGRMVSALSGVGTTVGVFVLTYLLFSSKKISIVASLIYALSPYAVFFDRLSLVDSMLAMFGVWTFVFTVITVQKQRLDSAMLSGFALGGALLTKSPGLFFALMLPALLFLRKWPKSIKEKFLDMSVFVFLFSFTYAIALGLHNIQRLGPNFHMLTLRTKDYIYPMSHIISSPLDPLLPYLSRILEYYKMLGPSTLILMIIFGALVLIKGHPKKGLILFILALAPTVAVSEFSKTMTARYVLFTLPYFVIIASALFLVAQKRLKILANTLFIFFIIHSLIINLKLVTDIQSAPLPRSERSGFLEEWTSGYGIYETAQILKDIQKVNPDRKIVVGTEGAFGTLPDGLQVYLSDHPEITVFGVGSPRIYEIPESLVESRASGNLTYLVVNSTRMIMDTDDSSLKLIAAFPKAMRPEDSPDFQQYGPQEALYLIELLDIVEK